MLTLLFTQFLSWFFHDSYTIPECPELVLVFYTNEQIGEMINGLRGNEWDEVLTLEVLPPLPVDPEQKKQVEEQQFKDTSMEGLETEKEKEEGEILWYSDL